MRQRQKRAEKRSMQNPEAGSRQQRQWCRWQAWQCRRGREKTQCRVCPVQAAGSVTCGAVQRRGAGGRKCSVQE